LSQRLRKWVVLEGFGSSASSTIWRIETGGGARAESGLPSKAVAVLLGGVSVDERLVRQLAAVVHRPLQTKLNQALLFRASVVALTRDEKEAVLTALERAPSQFGDVRERFEWRLRQRL
jgi:hypothetical protein